MTPTTPEELAAEIAKINAGHALAADEIQDTYRAAIAKPAAARRRALTAASADRDRQIAAAKERFAEHALNNTPAPAAERTPDDFA